MPRRSGGFDDRGLTARGAATRERIVESAARLMYVQGANATTLDDVLKSSGVSKSQLYNNFPDKAALVHEVIGHHSRNALTQQRERLGRIDSLQGLRRWRDATVQGSALQKGAYGCVLGSMTVELSDHDEMSRQALAATFAAWEQLVVDVLDRLQGNGTLRPDADTASLAASLMAAIQGGYVLARVAHDSNRLAEVLDAALDHIGTYAC